MGTALPFPARRPQGYEWIDHEPEFDPSVHLALEAPASVTYLAEFGYGPDDTADVASPVAVSAPIRILSDEGASVMLETARRLRSFRSSGGGRIENLVRCGCYRSRWLRDLCMSPDVTELLCEVFEADIAPHTMPVHLGHMNFEPSDPKAAVDKWHHDTLPLDYVMMVSDPATLDGGEFEYFVGTKAEAAELAEAGRTPPRDRVIVPHFPGPGYAVALHGNMVVHRGAALRTPGERITMVNGYISTDTSRDDQSRTVDLLSVDDHEVLFAEWARHAAWRARGRLGRLIEDLEFGVGPVEATAALEDAVRDVQRAVAEMSVEGPAEVHHYERSST